MAPMTSNLPVMAGLDTVKLCDQEAPLEATFLPGAGMLCCSLRHRGEELLAQNAGVSAYAERGKTMGIPLLYPWANRLAGFDYTVAGRAVAVPHDTARVALEEPRPADPRGDRRAARVGAHRCAHPRSEVLARGAPGLERVAARAVRGVSLPPRAPLQSAPGRRAARDRGGRGGLRRGPRTGGLRLSSLPRAPRRPTRGLAGGAARDAPSGAR